MIGRAIGALRHIVFAGVDQLDGGLRRLRNDRGLNAEIAIQPTPKTAAHTRHHDRNLLFRKAEHARNRLTQIFRGLDRAYQFGAVLLHIREEVHRFQGIMRQEGGAVGPLDELLRGLNAEIAIQPTPKTAAHTRHHDRNLLFRKAEHARNRLTQIFRGLDRAYQFGAVLLHIREEVHRFQGIMRQEGGAVGPLDDLCCILKSCLRIAVSTRRLGVSVL